MSTFPEKKTSAAQAGGAEKKKRAKKVTAGACPKSARHTNTRVYKTSGRKRYCVCDDCGETWIVVGPEASEDDAEE